jgi:hypothetical protein
MPNRSTLKRPDDRLLRKFRLGQIGSDTVRLYLERGYSLAICCVNCPRLMEWTPPELLRRYGKSPDVTSRLRISPVALCAAIRRNADRATSLCFHISTMSLGRGRQHRLGGARRNLQRSIR